jgi:hypothetical protein
VDPSKTRIYRTPGQQPIDFAKTQVLRVFGARGREPKYVVLTPSAAASESGRLSKRQLAKLQRLPAEQVAEIVRSYNANLEREAGSFASTQRIPRLALQRRSTGRRRWWFGAALSVALIAAVLGSARRAQPRRHARASLVESRVAQPRDRGPMPEPEPALTVQAEAGVGPVALSAANRASSSRPRSARRARLAPSEESSNARLAPSAVNKPSRVSPRMAVDALAAGDVARAATLYATLAERAPEDRAVVETARILKARLAQPTRHLD